MTSEWVNEKLGIFFQCFKSEYFYWEFVILCRRLGFVAIYTLLYAQPPVRNLVIFIFSFFVMVVHAFVFPYHAQVENLIETVLLGLLLVIAGIQSSEAALQFLSPISVFTTVLTLIAILPIGVGIYLIIENVLVQVGWKAKKTEFVFLKELGLGQ